jgi:hypothetical protein
VESPENEAKGLVKQLYSINIDNSMAQADRRDRTAEVRRPREHRRPRSGRPQDADALLGSHGSVRIADIVCTGCGFSKARLPAAISWRINPKENWSDR